MAYLGVKTNHGVLVGTDGVEGVNAIAVGPTGSLLIGATGADPAFSAANTISVTSSGEVTLPSQPAFLATHTVAQDNQTGNGALVNINFTTEIFDVGSDYNGTNTFTAPITSIYWLGASVAYSGLDGTSTTGFLRISTSNRNYEAFNGNFGAVRNASNFFVCNFTTQADMDAADIAIVQAQVSGMAGNTVDFVITATQTYFFGRLSP